jgi:ketosteroid isomerase-like protein
MGSAAEEQKNKQVVRQFFEALNQQDTERIGQLVSSTNYSFHFPGMSPMDWKETNNSSLPSTMHFLTFIITL